MLEFLIVDEGKNVCRVPLCEVHNVDIKRENKCLSADQIWSKMERKKMYIPKPPVANCKI